MPGEVNAKIEEFLAWYANEDNYDGYDMEIMIGEAVRQLETLSEMMNRRMPEPGTMAICEALAELVRLKNHKDTVGKDAEYLEAQPKAWEAARRALAGSVPEPPEGMG